MTTALARVTAYRARPPARRAVAGKAFSEPPFWSLDSMRAPFGSSLPDRERIEHDFEGYARGGGKASAVVFGAFYARLRHYAQAMFQWENQSTRQLFGTEDLRVLERPWPTGTTADMLAWHEVDATFAGNSYWTFTDDAGRFGLAARGPSRRLSRMRPDWVWIVLSSASGDPFALDTRIVSFVYDPRITGLTSATTAGSDRMVILTPAEVAHYCVDEQTEILTVDGWKTVDSLQVGDEALTLNHDTGLSEWQPVSDVCVFPARTHSMLSMEGREHSSLTTLNHRWAVERKNSRAGGYVRRWATSQTLGSGDRIPVAAFSADLPEQPKYTDALVEAVAWFWTEGCIKLSKNGSRGRAVSISQSATVNQDNVARIRAALRSLFGEPVADRTLSHRTPRWQESRSGNNVIFHLSSAAGDVLTEHAPGRVVTTAFLRSLTQAQLELFITVSLLADGHGRLLTQKSKLGAEQFMLACLLAGYGASIHQRKPGPSGYGMWSVRVLSKQHVYPQESKRERSAFRVRRVQYEGPVWCPRTANQTWLARRRGHVYFTGNSPVPDPQARFRGMSWLTPVLREVAADRAATAHKLRFFERGASLQTIVALDKDISVEAFDEFVERFRASHEGSDNAFRTVFIGGGADVTTTSANLQELDYKAVQGGGETRILMAAGVHPVVAAASEGMQGSSLNAGNYKAAMRNFADGTLTHLWTVTAASLQNLVKPPAGTRLWIDKARLPFLQDDAKDVAQIQQILATALRSLLDAGYNPDAAVAFLRSNDLGKLLGKHSGLFSVQLQPPGLAVPVAPANGANGTAARSGDVLVKELLALTRGEQ